MADGIGAGWSLVNDTERAITVDWALLCAILNLRESTEAHGVRAFRLEPTDGADLVVAWTDRGGQQQRRRLQAAPERVPQHVDDALDE